MPLEIIRQDITKIECDAIVNAAKRSLLGGGGVDGAIHRAAGPGLLAECRTLGGCETGQAKLTGGYDLPCKYVIHTVGPVWTGGGRGEEALLRDCYRNSLLLAKSKNCESVAFPLISSGVFGYPKQQALHVAVDEIAAFLAENEMRVILTVYGRESFRAGSRLFADIRSFIDDRYAETHGDGRDAARRRKRMAQREDAFSQRIDVEGNEPPYFEEDALSAPAMAPMPAAFTAAMPKQSAEEELAALLRKLDESFSQMLLRKIDEKGMTDAQCYKRANIDRKLFSKIRGDVHYHPSKPTVLAFAVALELSLEETREMLRKAGFALSGSSSFDLIVEYFIRRGNYNIYEINEALFAFDQSLLGG